MATSKSSTASHTTAAKKARSATAMPSAEDVQDAFIKPLKGMAEQLQNLPLAGAAGAIAENARKDLQAMVQANQKAFVDLQAVVQRQTGTLKDSIVKWQEAVKGMTGSDPRNNLATLNDMAKADFKNALDNVRELSELAAASQAATLEAFRQRVRANVDEVSKLLQPRK
jgi:phasin family protein